MEMQESKEMMPFLPPPPTFNATADSILKDAEKLILQARAVQDGIAAKITPETATFANTLLPIAEEQNRTIHGKQLLEFYQYVSTNEKVREASAQAERMFSELDTELAMREDIYQILCAAVEKDEDLDVECRRLLDKTVLSFKHNGVHLPEQDRIHFQRIQKNLSEVKSEFERNMIEQDGGIWFAREELEGLPEECFETLEPDTDGKVRLTLSNAHVGSVLSRVRSGETRKKVYIAHQNQCPQNVPLLEKAIALRHEVARLLGYANHAEYRLEDKMEKSPENINRSLQDMQDRLVPKARKEIERLRKLKSDDLKARGEEDDGKFYLWDQTYYTQMLMKMDFAVDQDKISEYFPLERTIEKMLEIFARIFGMRFEAVEHANVWHPDVKAFTAWNDHEADGETKNDFLGYLYMDLHPRPGKAQRLADLPVHPGYLHPTSGKRIHPSTALICNFPKSPTPTKPTLLKHSDVWQLFHELGHGIHDLVSRTRFACFHGPATAQDFVEVPSQMLEKFCWVPEVLKILGRHWETGECMPEELIEGVVGTKRVSGAMFWLRSLARARFDMAVHSLRDGGEVGVDTTRLWNSILREVLPVDFPEGEEWGCGQATFSHLFQGYDAGFYAYLS